MVSLGICTDMSLVKDCRTNPTTNDGRWGPHLTLRNCNEAHLAHCIPHKNPYGNERADGLAKEAATNSDINLLAPELFFLNFSTPCIQNVNNTGTKYVRIMKQTAF